jgi:polyferredoxin
MGRVFLADKHRSRQLLIGITLLLFIIGGWFYPPIGYFLLICMIGAMGIGIFKGRNWCDWMCPRGSFWDRYLSPISRRAKVPGFFRSVYFRLFWLGVLMTVLTVNLIPVWGDYYKMGRPFVMILTVTTIVGLVLGIIYNHRIWCMFCPMGTMANWLGKKKLPLYVSDSCVNCGTCAEVCRMQIDPGQYREYGVVRNGDCLKCSYCVEACPQHALSFNQKDGAKAA